MMAITPSQWSHVLTIPESYTPSATTSGQTLVITESVIAKLSAGEQSTFWSNVQNGGGDVRICTDSAGSNQLPIEIVSLDNVAETCVIWTRKPTYDGAGELYVFVGKSGETQPAATDPFGRNAVWQDYEIAAQLNEAPSTATGHYVNRAGKAGGTAPNLLQGNVNGPYGLGASDFDGSNDQIDFPVSNLGENVTFSAWAKCDDLSIDQRLISLFNSTLQDNDAGSTLLWMDSGGSADGWAGFIRNTTGTTYLTSTDLNNATTNWQHITMICTATSLEVFVNGQPVSTASVSGNSTIPLVNTFIIGRNWDLFDPANFFDGGVSDARLSKGTLTPSIIATEYANQSDTANFYGTPTIQATGGGATVTADVSYTINAPVFSASADVTLPQPSASISYSVNAPTFAADATVTLPNPTADVSYTVTAPTFSVYSTVTLPQPTANTAFSLPAPTFAASATATEPSFNAAVNFALPAPTFSADAAATLPQPIVDGNFTITAPTFSVVAIVGGIAIIIDDATNVNIPTLSTNINMRF